MYGCIFALPGINPPIRQGNCELSISGSLDERNVIGERLSGEPRGMIVARYVISVVICLCLPPVLLLIPLANSSQSLDCRITHLMGFAGSLFLLVNGYAEIHQTPRGAPVRMLAVVCGMLVGFHTLHFLSEFSTRSIDYMCYQNPAGRIVSGANPYDGTGYLYPPLLGQLLALPQLVPGAVSQVTNAEAICGVVFYLFQFLQLFLILGAYVLSVRLCGCVRKPTAWYIIGIAALFVVNNPLWRTLQWNQINLWILVCILLCLQYARSSGTVRTTTRVGSVCRRSCCQRDSADGAVFRSACTQIPASCGLHRSAHGVAYIGDNASDVSNGMGAPLCTRHAGADIGPRNSVTEAIQCGGSVDNADVSDSNIRSVSPELPPTGGIAASRRRATSRGTVSPATEGKGRIPEGTGT